MIRKYIYNGETYTSAWAVRQAVGKATRTAFGPEPEEGKEAFWARFGVEYIEEPDPEPTPEEIAEKELAEAKRLRAAQVAAITVEVDGMTFDGDEAAQSRLTRAIQVAEITGMETTQWVMADNTVHTITVAQAKEALSKAMLAMGELWTVPYQETSDAAS